MIYKRSAAILCLAALALALAGCKEDDAAPIDTAAAERGETLAEDCKACHDLGSQNQMVGPHLVGIVGRDVASVSSFAYSDALMAEDGAWTPERLAAFILDPAAAIPGTKMAFGGITADEARDIIEFLRAQKS